MKVDKYYDVCCETCHKHLSTDFGKGFAYTRQEAIKWAREVGFKTVQGKFICPECIKNYNSPYSKYLRNLRNIGGK